MKILLLNDTGIEPHVGCLAVSDAHARMLGAAGHRVVHRHFLGELKRFAGTDEGRAIDAVLSDPALRAQLEEVDAVVVNGEGTLHHGAGTEYFAALGAGQRLGKATLIVNAVFEGHSGWLDVLSRLDDFCVRDLHSLRHARQHGLRCRLVPDSFLGAAFSDLPSVDLDGRIVVTDWHPARQHDVGVTANGILDRVADAFYFPLLHGIQEHLWRHAAASWARATWIITGRHHGVYLSVVAGRPFIAMPSNTHKIEGLIEAAGVTIPMCTRLDQVEAAMAYAFEHLDQYERLRDFLQEQLPLTTFAALGRGHEATSVEAELAALAEAKRGKSWSLVPRYWGLGDVATGGQRPAG